MTIMNENLYNNDQINQIKTGRKHNLDTSLYENPIMFKEKYPTFDKKDIADMLVTRREMHDNNIQPGRDTFDLKDDTQIKYIDATVEQYIEHLTKYDYTMKRKEFDRMITAIRSLPNANKDTIEVCNLLLGNRNYLKKMVFASDTSYRTNRIWFDAHTGQLVVMAFFRNYDKVAHEYVKTLSESEQLKWIFKHFDTVYFSGPYKCDTVEGFQKEILYQKELDALDDYDQLWIDTVDMLLYE